MHVDRGPCVEFTTTAIVWQLLPVMESQDLISVSRPIFVTLGLEGFRSRDFEYFKEMVY